VTFTLTAADLARYRIAMLRRAMAAGNVEAFDRQFAVVSVLVLGAAVGIGWMAGALAAGVAAAIGLVAGLVAATIVQNLRQARVTRVADKDTPFAATQTLTVADEGVTIDGGRFRSFYRYDLLRAPFESDGLVIVPIASMHGIVVPQSAFRDPAERAGFLDEVRRRIADAA